MYSSKEDTFLVEAFLYSKYTNSKVSMSFWAISLMNMRKRTWLLNINDDNGSVHGWLNRHIEKSMELAASIIFGYKKMYTIYK